MSDVPDLLRQLLFPKHRRPRRPGRKPWDEKADLPGESWDEVPEEPRSWDEKPPR
jgi:hypothetical protein